MNRDYWRKQSLNEPLFPDLLWSRPETKSQAGKLLIIGGSAHGFAAAATAYAEAAKAGVGTARVLLPDALQKTVGRIFEAGEYAPSTPSGSFGQQALAELMAMANWADATLLAGDLGRNSETAILLEKFLTKHTAPVIITKDAADYLTPEPRLVKDRPATTLVISFSQLQKLGANLHLPKAFTYGMNLLNLVDLLHEVSQRYAFSLIVKHQSTILVASGGKVSSTKLDLDLDIWRLKTAAYVSVWQLQNPTKLFEALTTAILEINKKAPSDEA